MTIIDVIGLCVSICKQMQSNNPAYVSGRLSELSLCSSDQYLPVLCTREWLCQEARARGQITLCKLFARYIFRVSLRKCLLLWELSEFLTFADLSKHDISPFPSPQLLSQWRRTLFRPLCGVFVSELPAQAPCTFHYSFSFCVFLSNSCIHIILRARSFYKSVKEASAFPPSRLHPNIMRYP